MALTLSDGTTTVTLHDDLYWSDEFTWSPVEQKVDRSVTGALLVQAQAKVGGRPVTLESEVDAAWIAMSVVLQLQTWAGVANLQMQLTIRGVARTVIFRHQDGALEVDSIVRYSAPESEDFYSIKARFMEVDE